MGYHKRVPYFEGVCGRATNVILAPSAGCEGFARRAVSSVWARKLCKLSEFQDQAYSSYVVPDFCVLAAENWPTLMDLLGPEN